MEIRSIRFSGYKSFSKDSKVDIRLDDYVSVLIGKNNCGKSSCIDVIEYSLKRYDEFLNLQDINSLELSFELDHKHIEKGFSKNYNGGDIYGNHYAYGSKFAGSPIYAEANNEPNTKVLSYSKVYNDFFNVIGIEYWDRVANSYIPTVRNYRFLRVNADRNIIPEKESNENIIGFDGSGATNLLRLFVNHSNYDEKVVEKVLVNELNKIMNPEAEFSNIRIQQIEVGDELFWEIYVEENGVRFALSKSGSGLKTIILMLINLHIIPLLPEYKDKKIVFAFEELENNLHPSIQKRLFEYLYEYAKAKDSRIIITTHSHIAINTFFGKEKTSLYHITKENGNSSIHKIINRTDELNVLDDLSVKASDLFQTNGIIWVEGPSDRVYINRWLKVFCDSQFIEGSHYQFLYYGGRLLSHYSTEETKDLINVLKTNRNAAIVIDSDKTYRGKAINDTKKRIQKEFEKNNMFCWITKGKEIENYIPASALNQKYNKNYSQIEQYELFPDYIKDSETGFSNKKVPFSKDISLFITKENSESILDLKKKIEELYHEIERWNK